MYVYIYIYIYLHKHIHIYIYTHHISIRMFIIYTYMKVYSRNDFFGYIFQMPLTITEKHTLSTPRAVKVTLLAAQSNSRVHPIA